MYANLVAAPYLVACGKAALNLSGVAYTRDTGESFVIHWLGGGAPLQLTGDDADAARAVFSEAKAADVARLRNLPPGTLVYPPPADAVTDSPTD